MFWVDFPFVTFSVLNLCTNAMLLGLALSAFHRNNIIRESATPKLASHSRDAVFSYENGRFMFKFQWVLKGPS
jgi:hypothetical protein